MTNGAFIKGTPADDGVHGTIEFNEYRSASYWTEKALGNDTLKDVAVIAGIMLGIGALIAVGIYLG